MTKCQVGPTSFGILRRTAAAPLSRRPGLYLWWWRLEGAVVTANKGKSPAFAPNFPFIQYLAVRRAVGGRTRKKKGKKETTHTWASKQDAASLLGEVHWVGGVLLLSGGRGAPKQPAGPVK